METCGNVHHLRRGNFVRCELQQGHSGACKCGPIEWGAVPELVAFPTVGELIEKAKSEGHSFIHLPEGHDFINLPTVPVIKVGDTVILDHDGMRQEYVVMKSDLYEETQYVVIGDEQSSKKTRYATLSLVNVGAPLENDRWGITSDGRIYLPHSSAKTDTAIRPDTCEQTDEHFSVESQETTR